MMSRSAREQMASDESNVYQEWHKLRHRYGHIFESPNSQRFSQEFDAFLVKEVPGKHLCLSYVRANKKAYLAKDAKRAFLAK